MPHAQPTKICSTSISKNGVLIDVIEEHPENFIHSEKLTLNIRELIQRNQIEFKQLSAVSLSAGPGSHTGLRTFVVVFTLDCFICATLDVIFFNNCRLA